MKRKINIDKKFLHNLTESVVRRIISEANQYSDMKVSYFDIERDKFSYGWSGTFWLEFPDTNSSMVNDFVVRDEVGNKIIWDNEMSDEQTEYLEGIIRNEIAKRLRVTNEVTRKAALRLVNEVNSAREDFYSEEDYNGNFGKDGQVKSYDIGYYSISQAEEDAEENGYDDVGEYLKYWFNEIQSECPFTWQTLGNGYGFHGTTLFTDGNVVGKLIYDQIMIDELPPSLMK